MLEIQRDNNAKYVLGLEERKRKAVSRCSQLYNPGIYFVIFTSI